MLNEHGYEIPDDTPVSVPTRLRLPQSRAAQIQAYIRQELSRQAAENGHESFEEANDLDVDESLDFGITEYERSAEFGLEDAIALREAATTPPPAEGGPAPLGQGQPVAPAAPASEVK